jgi:hypothetical protein
MTLNIETIIVSLTEALQSSQDVVAAAGLLHSKRVMSMVSNTRYSLNNNNNNKNDEMYQLDATIVIYYHKYLYMFWASICPSSGVEVVCYRIWCSALGVVVVVLRSRCVVLRTVGN